MIQAIDDMLQLWALWHSKGSAGVSPFPWARLMTEPEVWSADRQASIPVDALECANIDRMVQALEPVLAKAVHEQYRVQTLPEQKAEACRCSRKTFFRRIDKAHHRLAEMLRTQYITGQTPSAWAVNKPG